MEISSLHQTQIPPTFLAPTPLAKDIHHIIGSTMMASTIHTKIMNVSTVTGSTIQTNTLELNTILGSTIRADTLSVSTIVGSTIQTNTLIAPDLQGSTIQTNTSYYNALIGSTLSTTTLQVSSLTGSTIQTNTLGFFDTKVLLNVAGEYITFDFGTDGRYYNRFSYTRYNGSISNTINRIYFLGSNDNMTWFSLGSPIGDIISGPITAVQYTFTSSNYRYFRVIITEIQILSETSKQVYVSDYGIITVDNYYKSINTMTLSPNLNIFVNVGSGFVLSIQGDQYSPMIDGGYATYIGYTNTIADTGQIIPKKTAILALTTSTIQADVLQVSRFIASTIQTDVLQTSSIVGSTIQTDALTASTVFGSTMRGDIIEVSTLYASNATGSTIQANQMIFNTLLGSTIYTNTYNASTITTSTIQMNRFSIETLTLSGNTINIDGLDITTLTGSTIISNVVQVSTINVRSTLVGSTIQANVLNNNAITGSTIQTGTLQVSTLSNSQNVGSTIQATQFTGTNIIGSTLQTNALQVSTIVGSTIQTQQFITSTILGSTIRMNLLNTSTIVCSTIQISVLDVSTIFGSTIQVSTIGMSTIIGSTIRNISYLTSTITGSTIQSNTLKTSTIYGSSIIGSTIQTPYITVSTISSSTIIGNNLQANKIVITDGNNALTTSATNASQLQYITNLTSQVSKTGQANEWNAIQTFSTSSIYFNGLINSNSPVYTLGLNASNQLIQFSNTSGGMQGTLTSNYIPYASAVSTLSNSIIYRVNATDLAIGQTTSTFPTVDTFSYNNYEILASGEYLTFDLGTGGNYHNQYYQSDIGLSNLFKIHFFGSDDNLSWTSLGIASPINFVGSGYFDYTLSNKRYLRLVIIEIHNQVQDSPPTITIVIQYASISNNGGTNLFTNLNQVSFSSGLSVNYGWTQNTSSIKIYTSVYSPHDYNTKGYYTGTTTTVRSESGTRGAIVSVAGLTQTTRLTATSGTFSKIFMADKRGGLNGTVISGNNGCNFYMGTMANTDTGNYTDTLYLNSWGDSSAGNVNAVMFRKSAIGMRIYQGAVGAASNFTVYQDALLTDANSGNITLGAGSDTNGITFGPNATWSSYLKIGSGTNRIGTNTAQVISTNGNLHIDSATNTRSIYLNHYAKQNYGTGTTEIYGNVNIQGLTQQTDTYAYPVVMDSSNNLYRSQLLQRNIYRSDSVGWGGGVYIQYAYYKYTANTVVMISGKMSYWVDSPRLAYPYLRITFPNGVQEYYSLVAYTNNGGNHVTFPFQKQIDSLQVGWHSIYMYNNGSANTDGNDQLWINVSMFPGRT